MSASSYRVSVILGDAPKALNALIASGARPPVVKIHNNISHAQLLREKLGNDTILIVRMTGMESVFNRSASAAANAVDWCTVMESSFSQAPYVYWEAGPPLQSCDEWYRDWLLAAMNWCHARGYLLCVMTTSEGTPDLPSAGVDGWAPMWPVVQLAASYGYILGPQAYWIDGNMDVNDDWHMFRIYRAFRDYPGKWMSGTRIVFTETGIDLRNGLGWRTALGTDWPRYRAGLKLLSDEIKRRPCPPGVKVVGGTVFAIHDVDNIWPDFNYREYMHEQCADIVAEQGIVEVPPVPETEGIKEVVIYQNGCNQREQPTSASTKLGYIAQGTHLVVQYPPINNYVRVVDRGWVYVPNLQIVK